MNIKEKFLSALKSNAEKLSNMEAEKSKLEADFKEQSALVETLKADTSAHSETITGIKAELSARDAKIVDLEAQISSFNALITENEGKEKSAAEEAVKIVASVGVPAVPIIKTGAEQEKKDKTDEEINEEFKSITNLDDKQKFYAEHRKTILAALESNNK